ncbi:NACHT domain-containing protein [Wohlfahrtiimonas larvae]|uniref:NACHT domain-containing protein n=1 Tax=Wohlfahrtiimonas larvae TaxID=1157986 RepID=A0ABP9ML56_9GAMM|nr:NACHT domain-containing protein [Wohlfahrtiimonas larvae]
MNTELTITNAIERLNQYINKFYDNHDFNDARKAGEVFCKILLLNSDNENTRQIAITTTKFNTLIDSLTTKNLNIIDTHLKRIKINLNIIQQLGNIDSHDNAEIMTPSDRDSVSQAISNLLKLIFNSKDKVYIDEEIPDEIYRILYKSVIADENWRCEKILSVVYPNRKILVNERSKGFEFYALEEADGRNIGLLFLGRNISFKKVFEQIFQLQNLNSLTSLTFLFPIEISETTGVEVKNRKENIEKISAEFLKKTPNIKASYDFIEDYIWEKCLSQAAKEIIDVPEEPYFIDQKLHSNNADILGLDFVNELINNKLDQKKPIYIIFGDGGAGKTTFCDQTVQLINEKQKKGLKKKVILISSFDVPDNILNENHSINSIEALYSLVSDDDNSIDQHSLNLNISSGNILVIIDGLDEILSKLKEQFILEEFIDSVRTLNDTYKNCSVIITSRPITNKSLTNPDVYIFNIDGFDDDLIDKYLEKRFKASENINKFKNSAKEYIAELQENSQITPLILRLVCDLVEEDCEKSYSHDTHKYFMLENALDKIIYQLMEREIEKQSLGIETCEQYFEILKDIIFQYDGRVNEDQLFELVALTLAGTGIECNKDIAKNYHTSNLLSNKDKKLCIKYDSLEFWIKSRYLSYLITHHDTENDERIMLELARSCYRGGILAEDIKKYINKNSQYAKNIIQEISNNISHKRKELDNRKIISALLYLVIKEQNSKLETTEQLIQLYNIKHGELINNLSIFGDFFPLDFSLFKVKNGYFDNYSSLSKSNIPSNETIFFSSIFNNFDIKPFSKQQITKSNFDSECILNELRSLIDISDQHDNKYKEHIISDLKKIFKVGFKNGIFAWKSEGVYKQQCASLKSKYNLIDLINKLVNYDVLIKESAKHDTSKGYKVNANHAKEVKDFLTQNLKSEKLSYIINDL